MILKRSAIFDLLELDSARQIIVIQAISDVLLLCMTFIRKSPIWYFFSSLSVELLLLSCSSAEELDASRISFDTM